MLVVLVSDPNGPYVWSAEVHGRCEEIVQVITRRLSPSCTVLCSAVLYCTEHVLYSTCNVYVGPVHTFFVVIRCHTGRSKSKVFLINF